jgi:hypothetical protein
MFDVRSFYDVFVPRESSFPLEKYLIADCSLESCVFCSDNHHGEDPHYE